MHVDNPLVLRLLDPIPDPARMNLVRSAESLFPKLNYTKNVLLPGLPPNGNESEAHRREATERMCMRDTSGGGVMRVMRRSDLENASVTGSGVVVFFFGSELEFETGFEPRRNASEIVRR